MWGFRYLLTQAYGDLVLQRPGWNISTVNNFLLRSSFYIGCMEPWKTIRTRTRYQSLYLHEDEYPQPDSEWITLDCKTQSWTEEEVCKSRAVSSKHSQGHRKPWTQPHRNGTIHPTVQFWEDAIRYRRTKSPDKVGVEAKMLKPRSINHPTREHSSERNSHTFSSNKCFQFYWYRIQINKKHAYFFYTYLKAVAKGKESMVEGKF